MTFTLAHLSDAHIGPLPKAKIRDLLNKRLTGYLNWRRRSNIHSMVTLNQIVNDIKAQSPDHTAMTGDILNLGLPEEFPLARAWLTTLGDPADVSFVPGNHDAYLRSSVMHIGETFAQWCANDGEEHMQFPYLRVRGDIALIGLSSAIPTGPFLASGRVGSKQLRAFADILEQTYRDGLCRVVMIHHPPFRGATNPGRGLRDAGAFEKIIKQRGAELILHGHNHRRLRHDIKGPVGTVPIIGVASASAVPGSPKHLAQYHMYDIERAGNGWKIVMRVRGVEKADGEIHLLDEVQL